MYTLEKPDNVIEMLEASIDNFPENPFLGRKNSQGSFSYITYNNFGTRVDNARSGLDQLGLKKDDAVGIISNNSIDWAVLFFASGGLEARFVPMYEAELLKTWEYIITDSQVKFLFVSNEKIYNEVQHFTSSIPTLD